MKRDREILVTEYVHALSGELIRVDQLEPEAYEKFRRWLVCTWLNGLYRGRAEFSYEGFSADGMTAPENRKTAAPQPPPPEKR